MTMNIKRLSLSLFFAAASIATPTLAAAYEPDIQQGDIIKQNNTIDVGNMVSLAGNITAVYANTATSPSVSPDLEVHVHGYQTAAQNITLSTGTMTVNGNQTAENGNISVSDGSLTVDGAQKAGQAITVSNATSEVVVKGSQIAGTDITLTNSVASVGSQTAETGSITFSGTTINDHKLTITSGEQTAAKNITITTAYLVIQGDKSTKHNQIAQSGDISITNSHFEITGNQVAGGTIIINHETNGAGQIHGYQQAGKNIDIDDANLYIVGDQTAGTNISISASASNNGVSIAGNQTATTGEIEIQGSTVTVTGNQIAKTDITSTNSTVSITAGKQVAETGSIYLSGGTLTINGEQSAKQNIVVSNSATATVNNQTAETGNIQIEDSTVTLTSGNQKALNGDISVRASTLKIENGGSQIADGSIEITADQGADNAGTVSSNVTIASDQIAEKGTIAVTGSTLTTTGNQTAYGNITIAEYSNGGNVKSEVHITGNQTSKTGNISVQENSTLTVGADQIAKEGSIAVSNASVTVEGNQQSATDITIGENAEVVVKKIQKAETGININGDSTVTVGQQIVNNGSINIENAKQVTITKGTQTASENITIKNSNFDLLKDGPIPGNQSAQGWIEIAKTKIADDETANAADMTVNIDGNQVANKSIDIFKEDTGTGKLNVVVTQSQQALYGINIVDVDSVNVGGWQTANDSINIKDSNVTVGGAQISYTNSISIENSVVTVGSQTAEKDINITDCAQINVNGDMEAEEGRISLQSTNIGNNTKTSVTVAGNVTANGSTIQSSELSVLKNITLTGTNTIAKSTVKATGNDSALVIQTGTEDGDVTEITESTVTSAGTLSIIGTEKTQALVKNSVDMRAKGASVTNGDATAMLLKNVKFENDSLKTITAENGNILIRGTVDMTTTQFSVNSGVGPIPTDSIIGTVMLGVDATLNMHNNALLDGTLSSRDTSATIVKDGGDVLKLDFSAREYNGTINVLANDGSEFVINSDGLGMNAKTNLKDTNFTVTPEAYKNDIVVQIGSVNTTADTGARTAEQLKKQLVNENSYTGDNDTRLGFREMGTILAFGKGTAGNKTAAKDLSLNSHTLFTAEQTLNTDGIVTADTLTVSGSLDANGARVFGTIINDTTANEAAIADNTRVRIVSLEGENASVASGFSDEVLYDIELDKNTNTYQRTLKNLNAHVETMADGVDVVYTKNYRSAAGKNENQEELAKALVALSDKKNHSEGTLAAGTSLDKLLDAFDSTQSSTAALNALTSVNGATNTIAMHALLDSSSHHLEALRTRIALPLGSKTNTTIPELGGAIWADYTGGYDLQNKDSNVGTYTRTHQGLMAGWHAQVNENFLIGVSVGYENSISRNDATKFKGDTNFADLYASARTGRFNHRLSIGVADHNFETSRYVSVSAATASFSGEATGTLEGDSFNVGYELSTDFELAESTVWSPFASVNYANQSLDDLTEEGLGDAGLKMSYTDITQVDIGIGARLSQSIAIFDDQHPTRIVLSAALRAELNDEDPEATASFIGDPDNTYRVKAQERETLYIQLGAGISMPFADNWCATAACNGEFGEDRAGVAGSIGLAYTF